MTSLPIKIKRNGPLFITAEGAAALVLTDHTGAAITIPAGESVVLCRCGASKRKPFCDASHRTIGFDGTCAPLPEPSPSLADPPAST